MTSSSGNSGRLGEPAPPSENLWGELIEAAGDGPAAEGEVGEGEHGEPAFLGEGVAVFGVVDAELGFRVKKGVGGSGALHRLADGFGERDDVGVTFERDE